MSISDMTNENKFQDSRQLDKNSFLQTHQENSRIQNETQSLLIKGTINFEQNLQQAQHQNKLNYADKKVSLKPAAVKNQGLKQSTEFDPKKPWQDQLRTSYSSM